jgi:hypothetical protein
MTLDFENMFERYVQKTEKVWSHDRGKTVGASEIFGCLRKAWFAKRGPEFGYEKDPEYVEDWGALRRGDVMEEHWIVPAVDLLQSDGVGVSFTGDDQVTLVDGYNSATPDGILYNLPRDALAKYGVPDIVSDCVMLEMKSIDPRVNLSEEKAVHRGQVQQQMGIIRKKTKFKPWYAVILYVDASFFSQIKVFIVKFEPKVWKVAQERATTVFETDDPARISAEGKFDGSCRYCPFQSACAGVQKASLPAGGVVSLNTEDAIAEDVQALVAREREAMQAKKQAEKDHETAKAELREFMKDNDARRVEGPGWKVAISWVKGRTTVKNHLVEAQGIDLADVSEEGRGYEKMTITVDD